jgi:hypothetical protein
MALILRYAHLNQAILRFSLALLGLLCLGRPRLDAIVRVVYWYIRNLQPRIDNTK